MARKQNTDTNITQPWIRGMGTRDEATRIHTRPPKTCRGREGRGEHQIRRACTHEGPDPQSCWGIGGRKTGRRQRMAVGIFLPQNHSFCLHCGSQSNASLLAFVHILNAILIFYLTKTCITHLYARHHPKHFENINSVNSTTLQAMSICQMGTLRHVDTVIPRKDLSPPVLSLF